MPTIAFVNGIAIRMYYNDHEPAHFHAADGRDEGKFTLDGDMVAGSLSAAKRRLLKAWAIRYKAELRNAWNAVRNEQEPERIPGRKTDA